MIISGETIIKGDIEALWAVVTDVANWPKWNPHEEEARLDGSFVTGAKGWSKPKGGPAANWTITKVIDKQCWASESPLPGGKIAGENTYQSLGKDRLRCTRTISVSGPLVPIFWLYFGRIIKRDMYTTWAALEKEIARA